MASHQKRSRSQSQSSRSSEGSQNSSTTSGSRQSSSKSTSNRTPFNRNFVRTLVIHKTCTSDYSILFDSHRLVEERKSISKARSNSKSEKMSDSSKSTLNSSKSASTNKSTFTNKTANSEPATNQLKRQRSLSENLPASEESKLIDQQLLAQIFGTDQISDQIQLKFHHLDQRRQCMMTLTTSFRPLAPTPLVKTSERKNDNLPRSLSSTLLFPFEKNNNFVNDTTDNTSNVHGSEICNESRYINRVCKEIRMSDREKRRLLKASRVQCMQQIVHMHRKMNQTLSSTLFGAHKRSPMRSNGWVESAGVGNNSESTINGTTGITSSGGGWTSHQYRTKYSRQSISSHRMAPRPSISSSGGGKISSEAFAPKVVGRRGDWRALSNDRSQGMNSSSISVVALFDLLPDNDAIENLLHSHFVLIKSRLLLLLDLLLKSLSRSNKPSQTVDDQRLPSYTIHTQSRYKGGAHSFVTFTETGVRVGEYALHEDLTFQHHVENFQCVMGNWMTFPRLQTPAWQHIVAISESRRDTICLLLKEINHLFRYFEETLPDTLPTFISTFNTNLLSNAITMVLAYHHSWLPSVLSPTQRAATGNWFTLFASEEQQNLFQQMRNLYGSVSTTRKHACRILIAGENRALVNGFLLILSYFVRCSVIVLKDVETGVAPPQVETRWDMSTTSGGMASLVRRRSRKRATMTVYDMSSLSLGQSAYNLHDVKREQAPEQVLTLISQKDVEVTSSRQLLNPYCNVDKSMFGGFCSTYSSDFVMMGVNSRHNETKSRHFQKQIGRDLRALCHSWLSSDSLPTSQSASHINTRPNQLESAACIVINIDDNTCQTYHYQPGLSSSPSENLYARQHPTCVKDMVIRQMPPSTTIIHMLENVRNMWRIDVLPDSCVLYIEDTLKTLFDQSVLLASLYSEVANPPSFCSELASLLQLSASDTEMLAVLCDQLRGRQTSISSLIPK